MGIIGHSSVDGFFQEVLVEALVHSGMEVSPSTEYYLVGLLGEFTTAQICSEPIALRMVAEEAPAQRVQSLKEIGDTSLYMTGFFPANIEKQLVDKQYYIGMGGAAYAELAGRLANSSIADVYNELSRRFPAFVDVLGRVRSQVNFAGGDVVNLYQEWQRTRSDWIEERLTKLGVLVSQDDDKRYVQ